MPKKSALIQFTVEGRGRFPFDMLRYDTAWPRDSTDVNALTRDSQVPREVKLLRYAAGGREPEAARWESFGWRVVSWGVLP